MTRAPRHTTLADRAATTRPDRPTSGLRGLGDRGHLTVVGEMRFRDMYLTIRRSAQRSRDAGDLWLFLAALGLIEDDGRDLP